MDPSVSHLMFADDFMLFGTLNHQTVSSVSSILHEYATCSGQQVNYNKSSFIFSREVPVERQNEVTTMPGISSMKVEDKYLGVQILKPGKRIDSYDILVDKFDNNMAGWKKHFLNYAGRTILIQAVLLMSIQVVANLT